MRSRRGDLAIGTDGSVWLYRSVAMAPIVDAVTPDDALIAMEPLTTAVAELAGLAQQRAGRRSASKGSYREIHLLLTNIPRRFAPPPSHPLFGFLTSSFPVRAVDRRVCLFGVKLISRITGGSLKDAVDSVVTTLASGAAPLSDYERDADTVGAILSRSGMSEPSPDEFAIANAWWNNGVFPDTTMLVHPDHIHVFSSPDAARAAAAVGEERCAEWPEIDSHMTLTMGSVAGFDELPFVDATDPLARWASALIDQGAAAISIRSLVEPAVLTRNELRRRRKQYIDDLNERAGAGKMNRSEQDEMLARLTDVESAYAIGGPPTLHDCSTLVAFAGSDESGGYNLTDVGRDIGLTIWTMHHRQDAAMRETMLCSSHRANPYLHDLPVQTVTASGISSLSIVGDRTGALAGFTERDRQPAWLSPTAAASADGLPMCLCAGQTGSGKTMFMLWVADQMSRIPSPQGGRTPVVIIDPKQGSDHSLAVKSSGGTVYSIDSLATSDGVLDPMRFSRNLETGVELAGSMLMGINPWGDHRANYEVPLMVALSYGAKRGATCIGQALMMARDETDAPREMVQRVLDLAESSPMFRACVGIDPSVEPLKVSEGITLIKVGEGRFNLPEPGADERSITQPQRISLALIRMCVFGSSMAVAGRSGVVMLDEAWIFLGAGRSQVEELGRLARSQGVLPMLFTQRVTDALGAGLAGYISRGFILPMQDPDEARAACELFRIAPTEERMRRITARDAIGGVGGDGTGSPNWDSMRALRDKQGRVLRGSVAIYADLSGRAVPVEIVIPPEFFARASTNPDDVRVRSLIFGAASEVPAG